jgi:acid stress-induced BolA-like protein IbaG/YrbA
VALQISPPAAETTAKIREAILAAIPDAEVEVVGGPSHFEIRVISRAFEGRTTLAQQRLVYSAIAPLMQGEDAPVHAVDRLETLLP